MVLTDVPEVLPLLRRNYEANLSPAACRARNEGVAPSAVGRVSVQVRCKPPAARVSRAVCGGAL